MLKQARYTYCHNNIVTILLEKLAKIHGHSESSHIFCDIEARHMHGGGATDPLESLTTNEKPNILLCKQTRLH
jgi:hypothetical protein